MQVVEAVAATMEQENLTRMEAFEHFLDSKPSIPGKSEPEVAEYLDNMPASTFVRTLAQLVMNEFDVPSRSRLPHVSSIETVVQLIRSAEKILVLTGAGISTSCGIPDFRSATGVYSMLGQYNLKDPQDLFAIGYFKRNVKPFYDFARRLWPGTHKCVLYCAWDYYVLLCLACPAWFEGATYSYFHPFMLVCSNHMTPIMYSFWVCIHSCIHSTIVNKFSPWCVRGVMPLGGTKYITGCLAFAIVSM
jgi:hypothetical protein